MASILIVDDEIGIRDLLSEILSDEGYTVEEAENAEVARQKVAQTKFDLILLDIWMPDMDGVSLLKEWKADKDFESQVIMMSGHATIETAVEATKFGSLFFLEKPISMQKLLQAVRRGIEVKNRITAFAKYRVDNDLPPIVSAAPKPKVPVELPKFNIPGTDIVIDFNASLREVREATERAYFKKLIEYEDYQITRVARHAGLERTHLYRKLKALHMDIPRPSNAAKATHDK